MIRIYAQDKELAVEVVYAPLEDTDLFDQDDLTKSVAGEAEDYDSHEDNEEQINFFLLGK